MKKPVQGHTAKDWGGELDLEGVTLELHCAIC